MTVLITLTLAGIDTGPFELYSNLDGFVTPFATGVSRASLIAGYSATTVPDYTSIIRIKSVGVCTNLIDVFCTQALSDLSITSVSSTDPTTIGGSDGTITVNFTGTHSPFTYTLDGVPQGTTTSPILITGLSADIEYVIAITDFLNHTEQVSVILGQTATVFDADWIMLTYEFNDGDDLDTRSRITNPAVGQDTQTEFLGWDALSAYGPSETGSNQDPLTHVITWGNDNTGVGFESIIVNVAKFKADYPSEDNITLDLRGFWYGTIGVLPVNVGVTLWKGGTPIHDGCEQGGDFFCWTNPTKTLEKIIDSVPKIVSMDTTKSVVSGNRIATLKYDLSTFSVVLDNNDTTTPEALNANLTFQVANVDVCPLPLNTVVYVNNSASKVYSDAALTTPIFSDTLWFKLGKTAIRTSVDGTIAATSSC